LFNEKDDEGIKMVMMFIIFLGLFIFNNEIFFIKRIISIFFEIEGGLIV